MRYDEVWKHDVQDCKCRDAAFEMAVQRLTAIIERHRGEEMQRLGDMVVSLEQQLNNAQANVRGMEKALQVAAKWAGRGGYNPAQDPRIDEENAAELWIAHWTKEAR